MSEYEIVDHEHDVVVVGAGGAGLRATLGMVSGGLKTAALQKFFQQEVTLLQLKVVLEQRLIIWVKMIAGSFICMIQLRDLTGLVTRMP